MTIYVNKSGVDIDVGETEKGAENNYFTYNASGTVSGLPCVDSQWDRENVWNAWLYALGVTLTQADSFFVRANFTTPAVLSKSGGEPGALMGLFNGGEANEYINSFWWMYQWEASPTNYGVIYEDDGTVHFDWDRFTFATSTAYYVTVIHDTATDTATFKLYTASDDILRMTETLSTTGWSFDLTHVGLSARTSAANTGRFNTPWEVTLIKINSGTTEEFPVVPGEDTNKIMMIM